MLIRIPLLDIVYHLCLYYMSIRCAFLFITPVPPSRTPAGRTALRHLAYLFCYVAQRRFSVAWRKK
jgi:hypothetical protein